MDEFITKKCPLQLCNAFILKSNGLPSLLAMQSLLGSSMINFRAETRKGQISKNGIVCIHSQMFFFFLIYFFVKRYFIQRIPTELFIAEN